MTKKPSNGVPPGANASLGKPVKRRREQAPADLLAPQEDTPVAASPPAGGESAAVPACVEHGVWTPVPRRPPKGSLRLRLEDVDVREARAVKARGVMTFHMTGCSGAFADHAPGKATADAMARQIVDPHCFGGSRGTAAPSFFFHLGDICYKDDDKIDVNRADQFHLYNEQFYGQYAGYDRPIFAVPGNHDGKTSRHDQKAAIQHFLDNFCAAEREVSADNQTDRRPAMVQPYPYWLLRTPLARVIGLHTNDVNGGQLDDPLGDAAPQFDWLVKTLKRVRKKKDGKPLFLALHYPPYSAAPNYLYRGDPNLGPTPHTRPLRTLGDLLQEAFRESKQYPDAVFSAHAHHYQRLTYTYADGRQVPYLIAGGGGHGPVESLSRDCDGRACAEPRPQGDAVLPPGLTPPPGDRVRLAAFNDEDFGFLRLTLNAKKRTLIGEYFAAHSESRPAAALPELCDRFTLDLKKHVVN